MDPMSITIVSSIIHISRKSGSLPTLDQLPTARALRLVCTEWELSAKGPVTPDLKESPAWAGYEMKILELGRALDFVMRKMGVWKGKGEVLDAAADIVGEKRYGRGRKSWIATLGDHGQGAYGAELAAQLPDEELGGYAIKALHAGGNGAYVAEVRAAAMRGRTWVKNAARLYEEEFAEKSATTE
jgi:hypothetical protein